MISLPVIRNCLIKRLWSKQIHLSAITTARQQPDQSNTEYREITKDRTQKVPVETSIQYLRSPAYTQTYGTDPVFTLYRRNHKGAIPPQKTRKTCIRSEQVATGNPCPICRDEYLVLHEENVELLKQFICPHTGSILSYKKTGLCQKTHEQLIISIKRAHNAGLITFDVPFREYNYADYYPTETK